MVRPPLQVGYRELVGGGEEDGVAGALEGHHGGPLRGVALEQAEDGPAEVAKAAPQARAPRRELLPWHRS